MKEQVVFSSGVVMGPELLDPQLRNQVHHALSPFEIVSTNLSDLISLSDPEAAQALNTRMEALEQIERVYQLTYADRTVIVRQFESRQLWKHLIDPDTGEYFPHLTAWISCSSFLGCRRTNFEALRTGKMLADVPAEKLIDIPKGNLHTLTQLSTADRNDPEILAAAKKMDPDKFLEKIEKERPLQHIESRRPLSFRPGKSGAKTVEQAIAWALSHDIAGSRDEALVRMAETAMHEWQLDEELKAMPVEREARA